MESNNPTGFTKFIIHPNGYWINPDKTSYQNDEGFSKALCNFFINETKKRRSYHDNYISICDLGCGNGYYVNQLNNIASEDLQSNVYEEKDSYKLNAYGYEGIVKQIGMNKPGSVPPFFEYDITKEEFCLPIYSWTICLNVMEYIPIELEYYALNTINRSNYKGLIISWKNRNDKDTWNNIESDQPLYKNCRNEKEVLTLFSLLCFYERKDTEILRKSVTINSLLKNVMVFRKK